MQQAAGDAFLSPVLMSNVGSPSPAPANERGGNSASANRQRFKSFSLTGLEAAKLMLIDNLLAEIVPLYPHLKIWKGEPLEIATVGGVADYLIARDYAYVETPLLCAIEAKRDNFEAGERQCIAEMTACRDNNIREVKSQTYIPATLERWGIERARGQSEYCRCLKSFHSDPFAVERITTEVKGGASDEANLALSCLGCNSFKGAFQTGIDPVTENETLLFHPRRQRWSAHFAWSEDATEIIGLTATVRATVIRLRLDRPGLLNLRAALRHFGVHPPEEGA